MIEIDVDEFVSLYENGYSKEYLKTYYNCSDWKIRDFIFNNNLDINFRCNIKIEFNNIEKEILDGCLLGDGMIELNSVNKKSCNLTYVSSIKEHVSYITTFFDRFHTKGFLINGLKQYKTFDNRTKKEYTGYRYRTSCNKSFEEVRKRWYNDNKKCIPSDIKLSPKTCLMWYIGDGCLRKGNSKAIQLSTDSFEKKDINDLLLPQLSKFEAYVCSNNRIYIPRRKTKEFLKFIGECPVDCYKYKWDIVEYKNKKWANK